MRKTSTSVLFLFLLVLSLVTPAPRVAAQEAAQEGTEAAPVYMGRAFLFEADLERGVELGWLPADYSVEEVMRGIAESLNGRLLRTGRFVEGVARAEGGPVVSVTFVGRQAEALEEMIIGGLSAAGRMTLRALPNDADFAACGSSRDQESDRFAAWLAKQESGTPAEGAPVAVSRFNRVDRVDGGPCEGIVWLARWDTDVDTLGPAVAALADPDLLIRPSDVESFEAVAPSEDTVGLELTLAQPALERLKSFGAAAAGREMAFAVDSKVAWTWPASDSLSNPLLVQGHFDIAQFRSILMAFAAEPLPAPLEFVEFTTRELPNVKIRDSPTAID